MAARVLEHACENARTHGCLVLKETNQNPRATIIPDRVTIEDYRHDKINTILAYYNQSRFFK